MFTKYLSNEMNHSDILRFSVTDEGFDVIKLNLYKKWNPEI